MPTGTKLMAGLCMAIKVCVTVILLGMTHKELAIGTVFLAAAVGVGFWIGWRVLGPMARSLWGAFSAALRAGVYTFASTALVLGLAEVTRSLGRVSFNELVDPILFWLSSSLGVVGLMLEWGIFGVFLAGLGVSWIATWLTAR